MQLIKPRLLSSLLILILGLYNSSSYAAQTQQQRIITTNAGATEMVFALGLQDQLIAVDVTSVLPKTFQAKQDIANIGYHRNLSAEGLLSLRPTVLIGGPHMGPEKTLSTLKQTKVNIIQLTQAQTAADLSANLQQLKQALALPKGLLAIEKSLADNLQQLRHKPLKQKKVAFLLAMDASKLRLAGQGTSADALIQLMGGDNIAQFNNYQTVSAEALLALRPDIILIGGRGSDDKTNLLNNNPSLKLTPAGQKDKIIGFNAGSLVAGLSIRAVQQALDLQQQLQNPALSAK